MINIRTRMSVVKGMSREEWVNEHHILGSLKALSARPFERRSMKLKSME
jgi:hypothetical protein